MKCPRCQHENRAGAKFCEQCATALARFCINCGGPLPDAAKFCPACAHPVNTSPERDMPTGNMRHTPSAPMAEGERRQATVLFADISGYTTMCAAMDAEHVQALLSRFYGITDPAIQAYGGHVIDHAGDGVVAVFGAPVAFGNDGERAVRAAIELHGAAAQLVDGAGKPLLLHIGIASGEVVAAVMTSGAQPKYAVTGDAVNLAARLDAKAQAGETIISDALHATISHLIEADALGEVEVKGFDKPVRIWRVKAVQAGAAEGRPFVGRHSELRQLTGALETATETGAGVAICVRGEPGIGKTRLIDELRARATARGYACHTGHVLDFGVGKGQDAIPVILKDLLQINPAADESARRSAVERGLGTGRIEPEHEVHVNDQLDLPQRPELQAVFDAMDNATRAQRAAEAVATVVQRASIEQPRLIVIEDIHWASPALLRHFARLTISATQSAVVFVMTSRIEGDPLDKVWRASTHGSPLMTIDLGPLRPEEARELAGGFIEASNRFAASCIERAEGNPLFLEQLLRNVQESETANIPPTIQSLVLARMDRLGTRDKQALQAASVVGKRFTLHALRSLLDDPAYACDALVAYDLVRPDANDFLFAHALIQEGVYSSLLKSRKRELHRRAAGWFGERELGLRAEHLDRADDPAAAAAYLDAASDQARRYRYDTALQLAERGTELAAGSERCGLALLRGEVLREIGRSKDSLAAFQSALELAQDDEQRCHAWMGIADGNRVTSEFALAMDALNQAEPIAQRLGLVVDRSRIRHMRGGLLFSQGNIAGCRAEHEAALDYARSAGDPACEAQALSGLGDALYLQGRMLTGLDYFQRCVQLCKQHGLAKAEVVNRAMVAHCLQYALDYDSAVAEAQAACDLARRASLIQGEILASETLGELLLMRGDYEQAEAALARGASIARAAGARRYESTCLMFLGVIRVQQNRREEALALLREALDLTRQTMAFLGPAVYGAMAVAAQTADARGESLRQGEELLQQDCVSHCYLWFYRDAMDATLASGEWDAALHFADALEHYLREEPLPWGTLLAARARALVAAGRQGLDATVTAELTRVREAAMRGRLGSALPAIDAALARA